MDKLDDSRETAAGALDATASTLHTRGDQISGAAHSAANKIHATANYVGQTNVKGMVDDFEAILKLYPAQTLAAAAFLGFLVGRAFHRYDQSHRTRKRATVIDPAFPGFRNEFMKVGAAGSACH
ncbi:MAG TPA: hypothetical protein VNO13_00740 [Candidatus Udaeobacter sp.]|nr:hypothetical protein [Candidatus Udaeobacter sp.]